jgi:hypothetical protein
MTIQEPYHPKNGLLRLPCCLPWCGCKETQFLFFSHEHKYLYFSVSKCAATTMNRLLPDAHRAVTERILRENVTDKVFDTYFKFGFVRNPWERIVSNYSMFVEIERKETKRDIEHMFKRKQKQIRFGEFVRKARRIKNHHWAQCYDFLPKDSSGEILLDYVGRMENFDNSIRYICDNIGVCLDDLVVEKQAAEKSKIKSKKNLAEPSVKNVYHRNKSVHRDYKSYYTSELIDLVAEMYPDDIARFGYTFEGTNA